ncbi:MAG: D-aminoacyl-tRNA deacylase [Candidatus Microgenomates bacterium]|jgi:D-tyrosyl-tRNA(Tyr) deacylase
MKLVIQRVSHARVIKHETLEVAGEINKGLLVLLGVKKGDNQSSANLLAEKLVKLRIMSDDEKKMNLSIKDVEGEILVVSQFTLYADTTGGNRPSFIDAADAETAGKIYEHFVEKLKSLGVKVATGSFGDYMDIEAVLDGPVTIVT